MKIYLKDFLELIDDDTFISIKWEHAESYGYQGLKESLNDFDNYMLVVKVGSSKEDGLIIIIDYDLIIDR